MLALILTVLMGIVTSYETVYPQFFRDLDKINSKYQLAYKFRNGKPKTFKQYVMDSSKSGKGTLIMRGDEWKLEWCKAKAFNQTVKQPGCFTKDVGNKYCYGQCNSIFIPGQNYLKVCNTCRPKSYQWVAVTLVCPFLPKKRKHVQVQMIYSCNCYND